MEETFAGLVAAKGEGMMGEMEQSLIEAEKKNHEAIVTAIEDLGRLGYLIQTIRCDIGRQLAITCCPPRKQEQRDLKMDGVNETFKV